MALTKTISTVHGFTATNAYHRVEAVALNGKDAMTFHVRSYKEAGLPFFREEVVSCAYDLNGANPICQAYQYLKTLPEFEGATDC